MAQRRGKQEGSSTAVPVREVEPPLPAAAAANARPSLLLPFFVFCLVLSLYLRTAYPTISGGDSGELVMTTCNLGIAHPPGYPLFTMLGWAWSRAVDLLWGRHVEAAYAINCLSALLGSLAAAAIAHTTSLIVTRMSQQQRQQHSPSLSGSWSLGGGRGSAAAVAASFAGVYAGVGFATMPTVWLYSIQGEVFALNNALVALLLLLTVRYYLREERVELQLATVTAAATAQNAAAKLKKSGDGKSIEVGVSSAPATEIAQPPPPPPPSRVLVPSALLGAFVCGLCLTNQHTTVFPVLVTSAAISFSLRTHGQLSVLRVGQLVLAVLGGLSPYAYLAIRSHWLVGDSWGDQRSLAGFLTHLLRQEYGTFQLAASEISAEDPGMLSRLAVYGSNMQQEMLLGASCFALLGLGSCLRAAWGAPSPVRRAALVLALSCTLYIAVFHKLANLDLRPLFLGVQARFWQQSNLYICIFAGIGVSKAAQIIEWASTRAWKQTGPTPSATTSSSSETPISRRSFSVSLLAMALLVAGSLLFHLHSVYPRVDHHATDSFSVAGLAQLHSFPPGAIVLLNGDLNHNMLKYPHVCQGVRPDLSLLSLQLMSWDWWVPMQRRNYPKVAFPGNRYHVSTPGSFDIKRFLDANIVPAAAADKKNAKKKKKQQGTTHRLSGGVFLCGPFKDGDHSNVRTVAGSGGATESTRWYEEHPFGHCSNLLPFGEAPAGPLSAFLRRGWAGVPSLALLPPFQPHKNMAEDSWEHVLYRDNLIRLVYLTSYASFHSNRPPGAGDSAAQMLKLAFDLTQELMAQETVLQQQKLMGPQEYRSAGVVYGLWAKEIEANATSKAAVAAGTKEEEEEEGSSAATSAGACRRLLFRCWLRFLQLSPLDSPESDEIWPLIRDRVDPYSQKQIEGVERGNEWKEQNNWIQQETERRRKKLQIDAAAAAAATAQQQQQQRATTGKSAKPKKAKKKKRA